MTRLLCTGDAHFGSGVEYGGPEGRLAEQEAVWSRILELAVEEDCDAVLVAGDVFEGPLPTPEHYQAFARPIRGFPLPIVAILGNGRHDSAMRSTTALDVLEAPELQIVTQPDIIILADGCAVACLPWTPVTRLVAARGGGDRDNINEEAAELLIAIAADLRSKITGPAVLMLHWSITGAALPTGLPVDQLREPVLDVGMLEKQGWDAVCAGHIHKRQLLGSEDAYGPMFYVGSPMPLNFGEANDEHGVWILDVGEVSEARFVLIESRPFVTIETDGLSLSTAGPRVDLSLFDDEAEIADAVVRVRYTATEEQARRIDQRAIRQALLDAGACKVFVQATILREDRARVAGLDESVSEADAFELWMASQDVPEGDRAGLRERHAIYLEEVR